MGSARDCTTQWNRNRCKFVEACFCLLEPRKVSVHCFDGTKIALVTTHFSCYLVTQVLNRRNTCFFTPQQSHQFSVRRFSGQPFPLSPPVIRLTVQENVYDSKISPPFPGSLTAASCSSKSFAVHFQSNSNPATSESGDVKKPPSSWRF